MVELDYNLLQRFVRHRDESAFAALVRMHVDLVFGTALRKLGESGAAQEVAQSVFLALSRKGWRFCPEDSLPAWLHRTTLLESKHWLRGELRRRRRERVAAELGTTMKTSDDSPAVNALLPLLDEALLSVPENQRAALLLRYYERRPLREVGASLGISEDAAQKRVAIALARVSGFFQRRGFRTAGTAAAAATLQQAAIAAPPLVASSVVQSVLASTSSVTSLTSLLARVAALPKAPTLVVCVVMALAPASLQWSKARAVSRETAQLQGQLTNSLGAVQELELENNRLRERAAKYNTVSQEPAPDSERDGKVAANFAALKARLASAALPGASGWADDFPFVRVPRSAAKKITSDVPAFGATGQLAGWTTELLNLSEQQHAEVETCLSNHLSSVDRLAANASTATNWVTSDGTYHEKISVPALAEAQGMENTLATNLLGVVGPDGLKTVLSPFTSYNQWLSSEKILHTLASEPEEFDFSIRPNDSGEPSISSSWKYHLSTGGPIDDGRLPEFLRERILPWLAQNGFTNGVFQTWPK
jgi:RNA polymerase sigma factor (sigma-70 family)